MTSTTATTTVKLGNYLPTGPVPSFPSSTGVTITLPQSGMLFFSKVDWVLDGELKQSYGNNAQIENWIAESTRIMGETSWKNNYQKKYNVSGWVLVGKGITKGGLKDKDIIAIGLEPENNLLQQLSVGRVKASLVNGAYSFT